MSGLPAASDPAPREPDRRALPAMTYTGFDEFLRHTATAGMNRIDAPSDMSTEKWDQVRASLRTLALIGPDRSATLELHRLARGELTLLDVLRDRYGEAVVEGVAANDPDVNDQLATDYLASSDSLHRFASLARQAYRAAGQPKPSSRQRRVAGTPAVSSKRGATSDPARGLLEREADLYLKRIETLLDQGDFDAVVDLQAALHRTTDQLRRS